MSSPERVRFRFEAFYNWPGLLGLALIAVNAALALAVFAADLWFGLDYEAVAYAVLGLGALLGLAVAGIGGLVGLRRRRRGIPSRVLEPWTLDLTHSRDRRFALAGLVATVLLVGAVTSGMSRGVRYMESREFCADVCHTVMEPQGTAALHSPHAKLDCVACHVGPGAVHFAEAKLNGMNQLWGVVTGRYERPIRIHEASRRTVGASCESCHARERWVGSREKRLAYFAGDDENTPHPVVMRLEVGGVRPGTGRGAGIHYHMLLDRKVTYVADEEGTMQWVRVTDAAGETRTYRREEDAPDDAVAEASARAMDCLDCHNRPAHRFEAPTTLVNEMLADRVIDRSLASIKVEGVTLLEEAYPDRESAFAAIDERLRELYADEADPAAVEAAIAALQGAWARNFFPQMEARWSGYPSHLSHLNSPGCFRCHNDELIDEDGSALFSDCTSCHVVLAQGHTNGLRQVDLLRGEPFYHFTDDDVFEDYEDCASCHNGGTDIY